jgi:cysteine sulfinate desulfinase/cysteine desulfurase-like protein
MKETGDNFSAPIKNGQTLNFYGHAVAPEIPAIRRDTDELVQTYQKYVPGSRAASNYLLSMSAECRELIKQLLLQPEQRERYNVEFFSGTSRAMEIALARAGGRPAKIILSPFEHPSVVDVSRWFASISGAEVHQVQFEPGDYFRHWQDQEDKLIEEVLRESSRDSRSSVLILSEVSYATGGVIPVLKAVQRLQRQPHGSTLKIILDGAHAAGNGQAPHVLDECDSYVFSAHKWLLAPEPCGVVLSQHEGKVVPYDAWNKALPATTANGNMMAGLLSSLRLIEELKLERLWAHSRELRKRFINCMRCKFSIVGEDTGMESSLMLAVCPRPGKRWKYEAVELREYLQRNDVHVLVMSIDPHTPWIRVAFPCFIEVRHVNILCSVLEEAVS